MSNPKIKKPITPDDPRHGTYAGYLAERRQLGGREGTCETCRAAERQYQSNRRRQLAYGRPYRTQTVGTGRRLRALMMIGWPGTYLADRLGVLRSNLPLGKYEHVSARVAKATAELYQELMVRSGPSSITMSRAAACGWAAPDQWLGRDMDDPAAAPSDEATVLADRVVVDRALSGARQADQRLELTHEERVALVHRAEELGIPHTTTKKYLKVSNATFDALLNTPPKEND